MNLWRWIADAISAWREPFDVAEEWDQSLPPIPEDLDCPDTQPTTPGALDSDLARLE